MTMSNRKLLLFVHAVFLLAASSGYAEQELVIQDRVSVSSTLAGHVMVGSTPAAGVTVELYSSDWQMVLASTKTDTTGHFSLQKPAKGKLFYIQLSSPGLKPYRLRIRLKKHSPPELVIHLSVAE